MTTKTPAARKPRLTAAAKAALAEQALKETVAAVKVAAKEQVEADAAAAREAERIVAIEAARKQVAATSEALEAALAAGEAEAVIAAAAQLDAATKAARRAVSTSTRKRSGVVRPRHTPGRGLWVLVDAEGIAKEADFRPSLARDRSQAKKLQRNEQDARLAACELVLRSEYEAREPVSA